MKSTKTVQPYKNTAAKLDKSSSVNESKKFVDKQKVDKQNPQNKPVNGKNSPFDFRCPQYDERSSVFVNAGTHYGIGSRQPVGHFNNPEEKINVLPETRRSTLQIDDLG